MPDQMQIDVKPHEDLREIDPHVPGPAAGHPAGRAKPAPPRSRRSLKLFGAVALIAAAALAAYGIVARQNSEKSLAEWTRRSSVVTVQTVSPRPADAPETLKLPGDVQAFYEAPIYARVSGYVQSWSKDIGAHVKAGQALALIDTPDLDQEMAQARADLASADANAQLADLTAKRWHALLASNAVSVQSADEKAGAAQAGRAAVNAGQAKVDRLRAMQSFKRLTAPFDGVVTARNTDVGALINAGSGAAVPLFKVADMHEMRVYVHVPQAFASQLKPGLQASLVEPQYPGERFPATLATTSQSVAVDSRTVLVELSAANPDGKLWPGTYAEVSFELPADPGVLRVPSSALIFRSKGAELATVGPDGKIVMKPVTVGKNLGRTIEVISGVLASDRVVAAPPDTLEDGDAVDVARGATPAGGA
jgi:RND family efflux transporter MFP subunit